ncbi:ABC transporter permease [Corynebacterium flavescens]|uniref:ABC transporter permease n=1 Tax=Corynebacterium flavescens TaxID=28028 RepID=UPI000EF108FA|nr:multidrug ABC transporter permease [Corynebacterium flavescens]
MTLKILTQESVQPPSVWDAAWIITVRVMRSWKSQISVMVTNWLFPVFVTVLFLGLFGGALTLPAQVSYTEFLIPGMLAVTMLFGLDGTTLTAAADAARGVNDRLRSFPINAASIVLGRCIADMISSLITLAIMVAFALLIGWRPDTTPGNALLAFMILMLFRFAMLWIGLYIGYGAKSVESVAYIQILVWPIAFFSSVFVNPATMPAWLGALAELNPVSATASAVRDLLGSATWQTQSLTGEYALAGAIAWPLLLTLIFLPIAARRFRRGGQ